MGYAWGSRWLTEISILWEFPEVLGEKSGTGFLAIMWEVKLRYLGINERCDSLKAGHHCYTFVLVGSLNDPHKATGHTPMTASHWAQFPRTSSQSNSLSTNSHNMEHASYFTCWGTNVLSMWTRDCSSKAISFYSSLILSYLPSVLLPSSLLGPVAQVKAKKQLTLMEICYAKHCMCCSA